MITLIQVSSLYDKYFPGFLLHTSEVSRSIRIPYSHILICITPYDRIEFAFMIVSSPYIPDERTFHISYSTLT